MSAVAALASHSGALSRRSILGIFRQPQVVFPSMFFPLFFAALNAAAFDRTTSLPDFPPVESFLQFLLPATIMQGVLFGSTSAGNEMAIDIQNGFFDRLIASPVSRTSILVGRLAGAGVLGVIQTIVFILILWPFGADVRGGFSAMAVLCIAGGLMAMGIGGFGLALALRSGSSEAVQGSFPLVFVLLFMSSAFFPRQLMDGWYKAVASNNPLSWLVEALRHQVIVGFDVGEAAKAIGIGVAICVLSISIAGGQLRRRLAAAA
jgi:ABC-2 type transport system permease protein